MLGEAIDRFRKLKLSTGVVWLPALTDGIASGAQSAS